MYIPATYYLVKKKQKRIWHLVCMRARKNRHVLGMHMLACILSCVSLSLNWSDSWHWLIMFIKPQINLTLHPCHSQNSFISRCLTWKQWLIPSAEYADLKMLPNESLCSGCWVKLWHSAEIWWGKRKKKKNHLLIFQGSVFPLTSCPTAPRETASSSLALMRQATVTVTSELSACKICRVCVLANVICAHTSVTAHTDC